MDCHEICYRHSWSPEDESDFSDSPEFSSAAISKWKCMLLYRLKYLNIYLLVCHKIMFRHSWLLEDQAYWLQPSPDFSSSYSSYTWLTFMVLSEMSQQQQSGLPWNLVQISIFPQNINYKHFGDSLTFPLAPSSGQNLNLSSWSIWASWRVFTSPSITDFPQPLNYHVLI